MSSPRTFGALLTAALAASAVGCGPPKPSVRYQGNVAVRAPIPAESVEVLREHAPSAPFKELGTISVTCPSQAQAQFGAVTMIGGCSYEHAVHLAAQKAAESGADGMHSVVESVNSAGAVVSLRATAFYYLSKPPTPESAAAEATPPSKTDAGPTVEERLKRLEKMRDDGVITPEEYATKRAQLLDQI